MNEQMLDLAVVRIDGDTQPRVAIDQHVVAEYSELIKTGIEMPAIEVVHDGADYWLVDGFHRFFAHRAAGRQQIQALVATGVQGDAQWRSLAANKTHGLRRTNGDKQKAVVRAIKMRPELSDSAIAEHTGVSVPTVSKYRASLASSLKSLKTDTRVSTRGTVIQTSKIGRHHSPRGRVAAGIARGAFTPVRTGTPPRPMTALSMPQDPEMGARTLIELFSADYLRVLAKFLINHLEGVAA